jgi:CTP-dependent riboflavin kinase
VPWVQQQARERLGFEPYPGTLNLKLTAAEARAAWHRLTARPGIALEPEPGFCAARCYPLRVEGRLPAAAIVPEVPDYPRDTVELLAPVGLRAELALSDGSALTLSVS